MFVISWNPDGSVHKLDGHPMTRADFGKRIEPGPGGRARIVWCEQFQVKLPNGSVVQRMSVIEANDLADPVEIGRLRGVEAAKQLQSMSEEIKIRTGKL